MEINRSNDFKYIVSGALAGAVNGFFGGGGGMLLVPLFIGWCRIESRSAFATSIAAILPMCAVSAAVYISKGSVTLSDALPYLAGGVIGGIIGGKTFLSLPVNLLRKLFALLIIWGGVRNIL